MELIVFVQSPYKVTPYITKITNFSSSFYFSVQNNKTATKVLIQEILKHNMNVKLQIIYFFFVDIQSQMVSLHSQITNFFYYQNCCLIVIQIN